MSRVLRSLRSALVLLLAATNAWAQATAQINGTVADSSGAVLPGVTVVAVQTDTGLRREVVTDDTGSYALLNLSIGPYRLEASLAGFRTSVQTGVVLQVGSNPVIPLTLQIGSIEETIAVEAAAPLVETRNPAIGQMVDNEQVEALPLEGRNPVMLVLMSGAAADVGPPPNRSMTSSRGIAITGGQPFGVAYLLDGAAHNNIFDGLNLPLPFPDALQEFRVETSSQNAQNGTHGGGTVSVVTKSGTNLFHGDLFEFARHHRFNATSPFAGRNAATGERLSDGLVRNQFGGTLGGPISRDRLFFFAAYQRSVATQTPADIIAFVPDAAMLAGDFTQVASAACRSAGNLALRGPFVNNRINPALFSPAAVRIAQQLPATTDPCGRIAYTRQTKPEEAQTIGKVDWQMSQKHSLFGRYMLTTTFFDPAFANSPDNVLTTAVGGRDSYSHSLAIGETMVVSNTIVNNIRVSVHRTLIRRTATPFFGPEDVGIRGVYSYVDKFLLGSVTGGFNIGAIGETPGWYASNTNAFSDDLTMVRGNHQFGFGASVAFSDWQTDVKTRAVPFFSFNGATTGHGLADFLVGDIFEFRMAGPYLLDATQRNFGVYAQDTWRISPRVTVNYGMRWEPWLPQQHQNNAIYNFSIERLLAGQRSRVYPQAVPGFYYPGDEGFPDKSGINRDWLNFQPRAGVSWDPTGTGRMSVRAGYGMNGDFVPGTFLFDASQAPPFNYEERLIRPAVGRLDDPWGGIGRTNPFPFERGPDLAFGPGGLYIQLPYDLATTRVHSWNAGVQREIAGNMAVSATYLGNYLQHTWGDVTGNPGVIPAGASATGPCTLRTLTGTQTFPNCSAAPLNLRRELSQMNPAFGELIGYLDWVTDQGWQRYHGLLLAFQRRSTRGLSAGANYTASTCEGLISQGGLPLNVGTGYSRPVSLINPPADAKALLEADKGPCDTSPRHIFSLNASVETPQFTNTAARLIASGWRLSGIVSASSGTLLSITVGGDRALSGTQNQRVNQVGDNPYGDRTLNNWFSAAAFEQPALGTYGNSGRNAYEGPGSRTVNLSLVRAFRFLDNHRIEARIEAFNAFNWFRWGNPITNLSDQNFGRILSAGDPRIMQFALKYQF
jgi:hypothetical protein